MTKKPTRSGNPLPAGGITRSPTKKRFDALAAALRFNEPKNDGRVYQRNEQASRMKQWARDCVEIASVCARFNLNFDRARFLAACGVEG